MIYWQDKIGTTTAKAKLDGTNYIDFFSVQSDDLVGGTAPDKGSITIQGVAVPTSLWAVGELRGYKFEQDHRCTSGAGVQYQPHLRIFPTNDNAGTFSFTYDYFLLHVDGTTSAGGTCTMSGTITAGDKTANIGQYVACLIDATNIQGGDMIVGRLIRDAGTYASDIAMCEFGIHAPVDKTGFPLGL